jgi:DNA-directed RNA polymerase specialized sigma24 family protein
MMARTLTDHEIIQAIRASGRSGANYEKRRHEADSAAAQEELTNLLQQSLEWYFSSICRNADTPSLLTREVLAKMVKKTRAGRFASPPHSSFRCWGIWLAMKKRPIPGKGRMLHDPSSPIQKEVAKLPQRQCEMYALRDWFKCNEQEICAIMGITPNMCKRIKRALKNSVDKLSAGQDYTDLDLDP